MESTEKWKERIRNREGTKERGGFSKGQISPCTQPSITIGKYTSQEESCGQYVHTGPRSTCVPPLCRIKLFYFHVKKNNSIFPFAWIYLLKTVDCCWKVPTTELFLFCPMIVVYIMYIENLVIRLCEIQLWCSGNDFFFADIVGFFP